jgi:predicted transcriptional regulator
MSLDKDDKMKILEMATSILNHYLENHSLPKQEKEQSVYNLSEILGQMTIKIARELEEFVKKG